MKVQIMTDTQFGNGKILAETIKTEFPDDYEVNIDDVKEISPKKVMDDVPDVFILGGAIRVFRSDVKSKKWLKDLNKLMLKSGKKIKYGTGFLTHALSTSKIQRFVKGYLKTVKDCSCIDKVYTPLLTAQVETQKGPIYPEQMENAKNYIKEFISWMNK